MLLWGVLAVWGLFALTLGAIHWVIVPRIDEARPALERWVGKSIGVPLKVGAIAANAESRNGSGMGAYLPSVVPSFRLLDVRLYDPAGREALHLPRVDVAISVRSLWRLGFEQLAIEAPTLDVRRTANNRIEIAGLDFSGPSNNDNSAANWFFSQTEFLIRKGTVRWTDDLRGQPALALSDVSLLVRNRRLSHEFRIDATPPAEWGERASLRGRLTEPLLDLSAVVGQGGVPWRNWSGELYADFAKVDVSRLQSQVDLAALGMALHSGQGALRAWADVKDGQLVRVTADLALSKVLARLGPALPELAIDDLSGRVTGQLNGAGFEVASDNLQFRTGEGLAWPASAVRLQHQPAKGAQPASTVLNVERLELATLAALATRLPLPDPGRALLLKLKPVGRLENFKTDWQGAPPASDGSAPANALAAAWQPHRYRAAGRLVGLNLAGEPRAQAPGEFILPGRPGVRGAQVDFDLNQDGGHATLAIQRGAIDLPGVFEEPLVSLDSLATEVRWRIDGERVDAWLEKLTLANADTEGRVSAHWHTSDPATSASKSRFPG
ncbi:MAG: TIGR02099 family protein, partial [Hydrogenophaga sp.]